MKLEHTKDCGDLKAQLSDFIDGDLDDAVCEELRRHLRDCSNCRIMVDTLTKTITLYRDSANEPVPPDVHVRLINALAQETHTQG